MNNATNTKQLYSFDIFDTLVTRRVATPFGIFAIIQDILQAETNISSFVRNNFYKIRIEAEKFAEHRKMIVNNCSVVSIDEIYELIKSNYNLTTEEVEILKKLEFETEIKNLVPIRNNLEILKKHTANGERVVLISDMYYSSNDLKNILCKIDSVFNNITIYSSADYGLSKAGGELYNIVKKQEGLYSEWHHYGDNPHSDIIQAKKYGIITHYCPQAELMQYELNLLKDFENNKYYQSIVGSAKLARKKQPAQKTDVYNFGASFAAPILFSYVDWIINQSLQKGFKTLYFIARDGYIPKIIADVIITKRNLNLKTKYLYGSRLAWKLPVINNYDELIDGVFINEFGNDITPKFLGYRLGVDSQDITEMLGLKSSDTKIKNSQLLSFAEKFKNNQLIRNKIIDLNKEKTKLLLSYFEQEIDFSENNIAFVDLYGSGRTQDCVAALLNEISPCTIYSFYLVNTLMKQKDNSIKLSYLASVKYFANWLELLSRTTEGQTIGYKRNGNVIEPITEQVNSEKMFSWGLNEYISGIKEFVDAITDIEDTNNMSSNTLDLFCKYFDYLKENLDIQTANVIGEIPYKIIGNETKIECAAPKIPLYKILLNFIFCKNKKAITEFDDIALARSGKIVKKFHKLTEKYRNIQKLLFNVYIHKKSQIAYVCILGIKISFARLIWKKNNNEIQTF